MIVRFRHKGLERFHSTGDARGFNAQFAPKLGRQLDQLEASTSPQGMNVPGWKLHPLKGDRAGQWAVWVSGNWRLVWRPEGENATDVDLTDYH